MKKQKINPRYSCIKNDYDDRDYRFSVLNLSVGQLPAKIDMREKGIVSVYNQLNFGSCHVEGTEILTQKGWKDFRDISFVDKLATVNPENNELYYELPNNIFKIDYEGDLIVCNKNQLQFKVTPEHKMLVRKWDTKTTKLSDKYDFVDAKDLGFNTGLMTQIVYKDYEDIKSITLKASPSKSKRYSEDLIIDMETWVKFLGIYIAEGTLIKNCYRIQLAAFKEREKTFIKTLLNEIGVTYQEYTDRFYFADKRIYNAIIEYGLQYKKSFDKFTPEFIFNLSPKLIKDFLEGHFMGDGSFSVVKTHYTSSPQLADDIQRLIFLSGKKSGLHSRLPRYSIMKDGREVRGKHPEYSISVHEQVGLSIDKKECITTEHYKGKVYCAEVPTYHTLVTRYNGKILISGNCVSNAVCFVTQQKIGKLSNIDELSRFFLYYNARVLIEGSKPNEDTGLMIRDGFLSLKKYGTLLETKYPYIDKNFAKKPTKTNYKTALKLSGFTFYSVPQTLKQLKIALYYNKPIVFGFNVYESFESDEVAKTGIVPIPKKGEILLGGHCMTIIGYDDEKQCFIVRNSWGEDWGDKGYCYFPYDMIINTKLCSDFAVLD